MKILVTGGAGFIGSHVCDALLARGDIVICVDNFNDYYDPKTKEENIKHNFSNSNFRLFRIDILNQERLKEIFQQERPDKVIHLAARAGVRPSIKDSHLYYDVNVKGTLNLLELAKEFKIKNFIFASSSSVYGNREKGPFSETDCVDFPISPYAATKKAGEELCYTYHHLYGLNVFCLRFFTVYGPRGRPDMAPLKFTKLVDKGQEIEVYGDGTSRRDYTYVSDIVKGVLAALDRGFGYEIFNLGGSNPMEVNYLISLIEKE
ncbi:MAG: NAD-dependent epimerase/dehydratase family protein, partial [Nanoarchaeota archaeon]